MNDAINGNILIISHQERILEIADKIVVIAAGKLTDIGSKDEIMPSLMTPSGSCGRIVAV